MRWKRRGKQFLLAGLIPIYLNVPLLLSEHLIWLPVSFLLFISWLWVNIAPYSDKNSKSIRLLAMRGGCTLCMYALYGLVFQAAFYIFFYRRLLTYTDNNQTLLTINGVYALLIFFILLWNGILRMFFLSVRLRVKTRLLMLLAMWVPLLNLLVLFYAVQKVREEYDFTCYKESVRAIRAESDLCQTKYPLIMVHGIGFRDLKYFNYWGRIPRELTRYGATVYYGNQEAMGTIAYNAGDICKKILEVIAETGCDKVNIIAHSKGGLDARYAISKLDVAACVASLTTICTPHHGCRFVDYACKLPEGIYRLVATCFDRVFRGFGDQNPDFYTATHQFSTDESVAFNSEITDAPGVYYQSYASAMRSAFSDLLLWLPYCLIYPLEGRSDGLVSPGSAEWGEFQEVFLSKKMRGISHGDMIDLKREDYRGFDVVECYVQIVSGLKERGY